MEGNIFAPVVPRGNNVPTRKQSILETTHGVSENMLDDLGVEPSSGSVRHPFMLSAYSRASTQPHFIPLEPMLTTRPEEAVSHHMVTLSFRSPSWTRAFHTGPRNGACHCKPGRCTRTLLNLHSGSPAP